MKSKTIIFIDGENLRHKLAEILIAKKRIDHSQKLKNFDISGLVEAVVPEARDVEIRYYGAKIKQLGKQKTTRQRTIAMIQQKRAWNSNLKNQAITYIEAGALRLRTTSYYPKNEYLVEKGVDTSIAVDMIVSCLKHQIKNVVLISSDADLLPAVKALRQENIHITYVAHDGFILPSLSQFSNRTRVFSDQQIVDFFDANNKQGSK